MRDFGVPASFAKSFALMLPLAELTVAALLVNASTRIAGAAGAIGLLAIFSAAIAVQLAGGRAPNCQCFGQVHPEPVSWKTLARNGLLALLAVIALKAAFAGDTPSTVAWMGDLDSLAFLAIVLGVTLIGLAAAGITAFVSLLRAHGRVLLRVDQMEQRLTAAGLNVEGNDAAPSIGLAPGTIAPAFTSIDTAGASVSLSDLLAPRLPLLLLFTSRNCGPCRALLPKVAAWQDDHAAHLTIAIASGGEREASIAEAEEHGLERVLVDRDLAVYEAYQASGTPSAVLVAADGTIASHVAPGAEWIEKLLNRALADERGDQEPFTASPAPDLVLTGLAGESVSLARAGEEMLVLFWNPGCGFCSSMQDDLLAWERHSPIASPRMVIVSSGDEVSVRAEGFSSTVVLDPEFTVGAAFGISGTPMAILIDAEGRIASAPAAGAEAVFALAGGRNGVDSGNGVPVGASVQR